MIAEVLTRKVSRPFKGLADYLNGNQSRVETSFFLNCSFDDPNLNLKEIKALQTVAKSEADKTYHFVISLREGEKLNDDEIKRAVNMCLKTLGYENHQALVTAHNDTANFHIHVGVNKVCPKTERTISPYKDYEKLDRTCAKLEKIFGLQQDNRIGQGTNKNKRLYDGRQSFQEWVSDLSPEIMAQVEKASSWSQLHTALAKYNLCIRPRGAGFVISDRDNKLFMKASAVDRKLSKNSLEALFGKYEKPDLRKLPQPDLIYEAIPKEVKKHSPLYQEFIEAEKAKRQTRNDQLNILYDQHSKKIITLKDWYSDVKKDLHGKWLVAKRERNKILFNHRQTMKERFDQYYSELQQEKARIIQSTSPVGWRTFILNEAHKGERDALSLLRKKPKRKPLIKDNFISIKGPQIIAPGFHKVTPHGELVYRFGRVQVRDVGDRVNFYGDLSDKEGLVKALRVIELKHGRELFINGTKNFKGIISESIGQNNMKIKPRNIQAQGRGAPGRGR